MIRLKYCKFVLKILESQIVFIYNNFYPLMRIAFQKFLFALSAYYYVHMIHPTKLWVLTVFRNLKFIIVNFQMIYARVILLFNKLYSMFYKFLSIGKKK